MARMVAAGMRIEHRREALTVMDAGKQRQHLAVAFERVQLDHRFAGLEPVMTGGADEILDAGMREHIVQAERRELLGFLREEGCELEIDFLARSWRARSGSL